MTNTSYGVITSPNYPTFTPNTNCVKKIVVPSNSYIRVYVTDLNIERAENNGE